MLKIFLYLIEGFIIGYFDFKFIKKDFNYYLISFFSIIFTLSHVIAEQYLVYDYLSVNFYQKKVGFKGKLKQAFKTAGLKMNLINNETIGILVPYRDAAEKLLILEELCKSDYPSEEDYRAIKALLKELQSYTVNVREHNQILVTNN